MDASNVLEQYRKQIIDQAIREMRERFNAVVETSLAVLNGRKVNPDEWEEVGEEIRGEPKPKKVVVKMVAGKKRARKSCPVKGCKNVFAPRFGGFCLEHRTSSGYRAWRTRKTASEFVTTEKASLDKAIKKSKRDKKAAKKR